MSGNVLEITIRRIAIVALAGAVGFGVWRMTGGAKDAFAMAEDRLGERVEEYLALRKTDDQVAIYNLMDPEQRKIKDLRTYLEFHVPGVIKTIELSWENPHIDAATRRATVMVNSTVELVPGRLPPPFSDLKEEHEEHLRREGSEELEWVWRDDNWFLRMDRTFVTGKSPDGREIRPLKPMETR